MNSIHAPEDSEVLKMKNNKDIIQPNELSQDTKASMKTRIISAIIGCAVVIPIILVGDIFIFVFMIFVLLVSTYEIIHCAKKKYNPALYITAFVLALLMTFWPIIRSIPTYIKNVIPFSWHIFPMFTELNISIPVLALSVFGLFTLVLIDKGFTVRDACFIFTMMLTITVGYQCALIIRYLPSIAYHGIVGESTVAAIESIESSESYFNLYDNLESCLLIVYILIGTFMTDVGAYFVGVFFGKHKMLERVSPKKTWEGFFGGVFFSIICSFGFAMAFLATGHPLVIGVLDLKHWYIVLILSCLLPLSSVLGDFVFSSAKRYFNIKDFGNIIPGHGGILDRLDSVIFSMITAGVFLSLFQYWSQFQ